ncbi:unnamed protein product [Gadus morhua 'NCC']
MRKMEVREVWKIEMAAIRTDVTAIKAGFDDFKTAIAAELATLSSSMSDTECSLTVCSDDVDFLKRETEELIKDYKVFDDDDVGTVQEALTTQVLNIFVVSKARDGDLQKQAGIAIEGAEVLFGIPDVAHACTYLMGLIYALELRRWEQHAKPGRDWSPYGPARHHHHEGWSEAYRPAYSPRDAEASLSPRA